MNKSIYLAVTLHKHLYLYNNLQSMGFSEVQKGKYLADTFFFDKSKYEYIWFPSPD